MHRSCRLQTIMNALARQPAVPLSTLVELTGASTVTLRRDLTHLAEQGLVDRVHGGVRRPRPRGEALPFSDRLDEDHAAKEGLARVAAAIVRDGESLIVDNGTTCYAVARALAGRPVTALALSLHAAAALAARPGVAVVVPGGPVQSDSLSFVGADALTAVSSMRADVAFLGACSASPEHGLTAVDYAESRVKAAVLSAAARRVLVTTAEKLNGTSTFAFGGIEQLTDLVVTDDAAPAARAEFEAAGVTVHVVTREEQQQLGGPKRT